MRKWVSGVTLIETLITIGVMAVLLTLVVPSMASMLERQRVQGVAEQAALDLNQARSEALSRQESVFLSTRVSSGAGSCYVLNTGSRDGCSCAVSGPPVCDAGSAALKNVAFAPGHPVQLLSAPGAVTIDSVRALATSLGRYEFGSPGGLRMKLVVSSRTQRLCVAGDPGC
jgi:type IV fimbrial biogenesis protein FimT